MMPLRHTQPYWWQITLINNYKLHYSLKFQHYRSELDRGYYGVILHWFLFFRIIETQYTCHMSHSYQTVPNYISRTLLAGYHRYVPNWKLEAPAKLITTRKILSFLMLKRDHSTAIHSVNPPVARPSAPIGLGFQLPVSGKGLEM